MKFTSWGHESHWRLFSWVFISCLRRCQFISFQFFCCRSIVLLILKSTAKYIHLYWGMSPKRVHECPSMIDSSRCLCRSFIFLVLFSYSTTAFMTKGSLWVTCWLVSIGDLGGTWTPSDIKNCLTSGLNSLKNVSAISDRNTTSCGSASILNSKRVFNSFTYWCAIIRVSLS